LATNFQCVDIGRRVDLIDGEIGLGAAHSSSVVV
jgi:hypothetical protein